MVLTPFQMPRKVTCTKRIQACARRVFDLVNTRQFRVIETIKNQRSHWLQAIWNFQSQKNFAGFGYFKNFKEPPGFMKELSKTGSSRPGIWFFSKTFENHGYISKPWYLISWEPWLYIKTLVLDFLRTMVIYQNSVFDFLRTKVM
jgi:hypothetical protein